MNSSAIVFQAIADNLDFAERGWTPMVTAAVSPLEIGAGFILLLAAGALVAALAAASRQPGGGGLRSIFGGERGGADEIPARETADELRTLIAEARKLSDELADRFDGRASDMARLMREADLRVARLEQVLRAESGPLVRPTPNDHDGVRQPPLASPPSQRPSSMVEPTHGAMGGGAGQGGSGPIGGDPMAREIYQLSDQGLPPVEIARRLGQHTGKVELILALRRG